MLIVSMLCYYYPRFQGYLFLRDNFTTVSTWLDCSRLMSNFSGRSREFIKAYFCLKTHRFLPLCVLGNRSKCLLLPIICKRTGLPTASRLCSGGTSLKSHCLNSAQALFPPPPCFPLVTINSATLPTVPTAPNTPFLIFAFLSRLQLSHSLCLFVLTSSHPHFLQ